MFRRARWLLLLAILAIAAFVTQIFLTQRQAIRRARPRSQPPLPANTLATSSKWEYEIKSGDRPKAKIRAERFSQIKEPSVFLLEGMEMLIYGRDGDDYDIVKSARATFDIANASLYSEGEVEITKNLPERNKVAGRLLKIRGSAMSFDARNSSASTEAPATFEFDNGSGSSVGAQYDSATRELQMRSQVKVDWRPAGGGPPMHLETSFLSYRELNSDILLSPPSRLTRGGFVMEAADSVVFLNHGQLERVEAQQASGSDTLPQRRLDYSAGMLTIHFTPKAEVREIEAVSGARLVSTSPAASTTVTGDRLNLYFKQTADGAQLERALSTGKSRVESASMARAGGAPPPARVLSSEVIELFMRDGGKEIERAETHAPAQVDFLPQRAGDKRRHMDASRLYVDYGAGNQVREVRAVDVTTRTESTGRAGKPVVSTTSSKGLVARFDQRTGQMSQLDQWDNFRYEEGERRATAARASLDSARDSITLQNSARIWDETGFTAADEIVLDQNSGDMTARGNVNSTRQPDKKQASEGLLSASEPVQARAERMTTTDRNRRIRYEGKALLWQSASRLQADSILIDKAGSQLEAVGNVVSTLADKSEPKPGKPATPPVFSVVRAASLIYDDAARTAWYSGGVTLDRKTLRITSKQLKAWFASVPKPGGGEDMQLDYMYADGAVTVDEKRAGRTRNGSAEHGEYYLKEERMVLSGGSPVVTDSKSGTSRGAVITWLAGEDRLVVDNTGAGPAVSRVNKSRKK
jgi:lipopolysaccharide export system protein LptA